MVNSLNRVFYRTPADTGVPYYIDTVYETDDVAYLDLLAEECAEDFHCQHDGWEAQWPRTFSIHSERYGVAVATFTVLLDVEPVFTAYEG